MHFTSTHPDSQVGPSKAIAIEKLVFNEPRCQARFESSPEVINDYVALYKAEAELPPIEVFDVEGKLYIVDGFHRLAARIKLEETFIRCTVVDEGTMDDAAWYATGVNKGHGLRRTNADKRKAVQLALESEIGRERSSRDVAEHVGVSHTLVQEVQRQLEDSSSCPPNSAESHEAENENDRVRGRDSKWRKARKSRPKPETPPETATPMPPFGPDLKELAVEIRACRLNAKKQMPEELASQLGERVSELLTDAEHELKAHIPVVCGDCEGKGCDRCQQNGWHTTSGEHTRADFKKRFEGAAP